jgi:hypothetical protein
MPVGEDNKLIVVIFFFLLSTFCQPTADLSYYSNAVGRYHWNTSLPEATSSLPPSVQVLVVFHSTPLLPPPTLKPLY